MSDKKRNTFFHLIFCSRAKNGEKSFTFFYRTNSYYLLSLSVKKSFKKRITICVIFLSSPQLVSLGLSSLLSIGCGCAFFEWLINQATQIKERH
jgi:hypothetical protein